MEYYLEIVQNGLNLEITKENPIYEFSGNIPIKITKDEKYKDWTLVPYFVQNSIPELNAVVCKNGCPLEYNELDGKVILPQQAFQKSGYLFISVSVANTKVEPTLVLYTGTIKVKVYRTISGDGILSNQSIWEAAVTTYVDKYMTEKHKPIYDKLVTNANQLLDNSQKIQKQVTQQQSQINNTLTETNELQTKINEINKVTEQLQTTTTQLQNNVDLTVKKSTQQQSQIDNAINIMGDYEIVQEDPTQIRFKRGNGQYGNTINLGGGLASKNMVNAGYDTQKGNSFNGYSSDYGIELYKAEGNYKQKTTNGYQLFDASKLPTKSQGGATVTNNGDGSFTVSGSGNLTSSYQLRYDISHDSLVKLFKHGTLKLNGVIYTNPFFEVYFVNSNLGNKNLKNGTLQIELTAEYLNDPNTTAYIVFYGTNNSNIVSGTIKPMLYQDGDGTWEPFTGGVPSPNPEYPQEIKSFEVSKVESVGKNLIKYPYMVGEIGAKGNVNGIAWEVLHDKSVKIVGTATGEANIPLCKIDFGNTNLNRNVPTANGYVVSGHEQNFHVFYNSQNKTTAIYIPTGVKVDTIVYPQIEKGTKATSWEQPKGYIDTPMNMTLRALPNGTKDTYENSVITRRVEVIEFDGSDDENWTLQSINSYGISNFTFGYASPVSNSVISNRFISQKDLIADAKAEGIFNNTDRIFIRISKDKASTVEEFKTYLKTHKTIAFIEKTPTTEQVTLSTIPSYYPFTNVWHDSEVESDIEWKANTYCKSKYTDDFFKQFFALQRTGKVYTVRFPLFEKSTSPTGEKLNNNKGLVCNPSTDAVMGISDYDDIPLFKTYDVNAYVNDSGNVIVTAMKGDKEFRDVGEVDVFVLGMSYYEKYWTDDSYWYYSRTDLPKEGYTLAQECVNVDGSPSSYALYSKYVSGEINGKLYSSKGLVPKRNMSYNNCETMYHKRGQYYSGGNLSLYKYVMTTFWLKYATLNSQSVIYGCLNYNLQYLCTKAENNVKRIIIAKAQAVNVVIGSCVSIGDKGTNSSLDRGNTYMHNKCDSAVVTKIESIDDTNSAIYVDAPNTFNTTLTTYITSMHWKSGTSDKVLGRDGSIGNLTNGKYPMVIQGIELAVGGYEVVGNAFMDIVSSTGKREVYITNNPKDITTNVTNAKANYKKSPLATQPTNLNAGNYVTHMALDVNNGAMLITKAGGSGSGTATGFCDQLYVDVATSGQREFLLLGALRNGFAGGLSCLYAGSVLSYAYWNILARLSLNGVKG